MPRKTSNKERQLIGTTHKGARLKPSIDVPQIAAEPVATLTELATKERTRIVRAMSASGLCTALDEAVLTGYVTNWARFQTAEIAIAVEGEVLLIPIHDTHGNVTHHKPMKNPKLAISESAQRLMARFAAELALSPASRSKQGVERSATDDDSADGGSPLLAMMRKQ
jgi:P27 family predicted phage terminase small subunit